MDSSLLFDGIMVNSSFGFPVVFFNKTNENGAILLVLSALLTYVSYKEEIPSLFSTFLTALSYNLSSNPLLDC